MIQRYLIFLVLWVFALESFGQNELIPIDSSQLTIVKQQPSIIVPQSLSIESSSGALELYIKETQTGIVNISIEGDEEEIMFTNGKAILDKSFDEQGELVFLDYETSNGRELDLYHISAKKEGHRIKNIPLWLSIVPPLVAIILALIFKEVVTSLFIGIFSGAFIAFGMRLDSLYYFFRSLFSTIDKYIINALTDSGHISIIVFSLLIGGMVAIISKNGGMAGIVDALKAYAKNARSSQFITWLLGLSIFFDDYANTLIVGNTMRPVTDKYKISREKLAYLVDSTAAPIAAIAFITTWIGAELSYIDSGMSQLSEYNITPYSVFISSLKYSFYPFLTLIFGFMIIYTQKDFGPMAAAEHRARTTGQVSPAATESEDEPDMEDLSPVKNAPLRWYNAAIPVLTVIFMTIFGLIDTGMGSLYGEMSSMNIANLTNSYGSVWSNAGVLFPEGDAGFFGKLGKLIGSADSYVALLWASLSGVMVAIALTVIQRIMKLFDTMHWMAEGFKTMMPAIIILTLAWALASTTEQLHTAEYLSTTLENALHPRVIPMVIFVLAAFIAFSTGSSWSTMAILYPIAIPTTYAICAANGYTPEESLPILLNVIATVLAASVLGDHCSPISDTTILSSLASDCNHIDHVRTQMPYALTVGVFSLGCVGLSALFGGSWLMTIVLLVLSGIGFWGIIRVLGR
jgi:Na+/H+ antiporter NhaC